MIDDAVETDTALELRFRTGAAMATRLGSQQLKDEITAVLELVKNAYDADATWATVQILDGEEGQMVRIQDNGSGMSLDDLQSKWAWLATENKLREERSPEFRRRRLGQKGVGRFAAEKLGRELVLRTRTRGEGNVHHIRFTWDELRGDRELGDYAFPIRQKKPKTFEPEHGTTLEIRRLRAKWRRSDAEKLRAQLCRLIDPETTATDFSIRLETPWEELNTLLVNPLPGNETHRISFSISREGLEVTDLHRDGEEERSKQQGDAPIFGPVRGVIRYFGRGLPKAERARGSDADVDWNVGIRLFRDGCRVRPYGEPGAEGDWLQIYRTRYLRGSRFRLKPHYLEGTVHISADTNPSLRDTTSREGLELNEPYRGLVEYLKEKVALLSDMLRAEELKDERKRTRERYLKALDPLSKGLGQLRSDEYKLAVAGADKEVRKGLHVSRAPSDIRNAHWECLDCLDSWKAPISRAPTRCREFSVGRDGRPTNKPGCGSTNIRRKENVPRDQPTAEPLPPTLDDVMAGVPAYISGIQVKPVIDWEMGENDDEAEVRPERRELAINGRHPAFLAADLLDGHVAVEGSALEELRAVAALTVHVMDAAACAWGRWHFTRSGGDFSVFLARQTELKRACLSCFPASESDEKVVDRASAS
jgi:hypothetical protein